MHTYIIIGIVLVVVLLLSKCNVEKFSQMDNSYEQNKCNIQSSASLKVENQVDDFCNVDDSSPNHVSNNNRLACREYVSKKIFLDLDKKGWCANLEAQQVASSQAGENGCVGAVDTHASIDQQNTFPIDDFTQHDNKHSE